MVDWTITSINWDLPPKNINILRSMGNLYNFLRENGKHDHSYYFDYNISLYTKKLRSDEALLELLEGNVTLGQNPWQTYFEEELRERSDMEDSISSDDIEFGLFYAAIKFNIYQGRYTRAERIYSEYNNRFTDRILCDYLYCLTQRYEGDILDAFDVCYQLGEKLSNNPAISATLAEMIVFVVENQLIPDLDFEGISNSRSELLKLAKEEASKSVHMCSSSPDYHCILGMAHENNEVFDKAKESYQTSLNLTNKIPRIIERGEVRSRINDVKFKQRYKEIDKEIDAAENKIQEAEQEVRGLESKAERRLEELNDDFDRLQSQHIQFLGFFAAIVAIVVSSAQVAASASSFEESSLLILNLVGGLLVAFSGFSLILPINTENFWRRTIGLFIAGTILVVLSFALYMIL